MPGQASTRTGRQGAPPGLLLAGAVLGAWCVGWGHANSVGQDGPAFVFEALALTGRRELRAYFSGQNIALGVIGVPLLTAISFGLAALARHPEYGWLAKAVGLAGLGAAMALGNIFTVMLPYPMDRRAGGPMRQASQGYGVCVFLGVFGNLAGVAVAATPVIIAIVLTSADSAAVRMPVLVLGAAAFGFALA